MPPRNGPSMAAVWRHEHAKFDYYGRTSAYSCSALEDDVRAILSYLGAGSVRVSASGCPGGQDAPSHNAWVDAQFDTLAPLEPGGGEGITGQYVYRELNPHQPRFMDEGACELVKSLQEVITQDFSTRDVSFRTDCVPQTFTLNSFQVKGLFLRPQER